MSISIIGFVIIQFCGIMAAFALDRHLTDCKIGRIKKYLKTYKFKK